MGLSIKFDEEVAETTQNIHHNRDVGPKNIFSTIALFFSTIGPEFHGNSNDTSYDIFSMLSVPKTCVQLLCGLFHFLPSFFSL